MPGPARSEQDNPILRQAMQPGKEGLWYEQANIRVYSVDNITPKAHTGFSELGVIPNLDLHFPPVIIASKSGGNSVGILSVVKTGQEEGVIDLFHNGYYQPFQIGLDLSVLGKPELVIHNMTVTETGVLRDSNAPTSRISLNVREIRKQTWKKAILIFDTTDQSRGVYRNITTIDLPPDWDDWFDDQGWLKTKKEPAFSHEQITPEAHHITPEQAYREMMPKLQYELAMLMVRDFHPGWLRLSHTDTDQFTSTILRQIGINGIDIVTYSMANKLSGDTERYYARIEEGIINISGPSESRITLDWPSGTSLRFKTECKTPRRSPNSTISHIDNNTLRAITDPKAWIIVDETNLHSHGPVARTMVAETAWQNAFDNNGKLRKVFRDRQIPPVEKNPFDTMANLRRKEDILYERKKPPVQAQIKPPETGTPSYEELPAGERIIRLITDRLRSANVITSEEEIDYRHIILTNPVSYSPAFGRTLTRHGITKPFRLLCVSPPELIIPNANIPVWLDNTHIPKLGITMDTLFPGFLTRSIKMNLHKESVVMYIHNVKTYLSDAMVPVGMRLGPYQTPEGTQHEGIILVHVRKSNVRPATIHAGQKPPVHLTIMDLELPAGLLEQAFPPVHKEVKREKK